MLKISSESRIVPAEGEVSHTYVTISGRSSSLGF
jgi:hypothetical protein